MLVPLSWLRDFAPFDGDPVALGETFDDLGMVVEAIERIGAGLEAVIVAHVLDVRVHPGADRVRLVDVDTGDGEALQIVCGAPNVAAGQRVALAPIGAVLPGDFEIARRKVRGEWSNGMICSARELGLGDDAAGIMVLPDALEVGAAFANAMGIAADVVYDLAIESNRPDAMCIAGVARDAAARLRLPFAIPEPSVPAGGGGHSGPPPTVVVEAPDLCPRFVAAPFTGVKVGPAPDLVARRLTLAGMRPISNLVDASNYVMLELGQPTHAYDRGHLAGPGFVVRAARPGERLTTLDDVERVLGATDEPDCLICDAEGVPVGIAGVMGGASSEISESTTDIVLEAAYFDRMAIARTSKRLGLRSEASARFERGCDPEGIDRAVARYAELIGVGPGSGTDVSAVQPSVPIRVRTARLNTLLGSDLTTDRIVGYLTPIGFAATPAGDDVLDVLAPSFRPDATLEVDVIEEVARHHGYASIARTVPRSPYVGGLTPYQRARRELREVLAGAGVSEGLASPLIGPDDHERAGLRVADLEISAADPLAREESVLRTSLLPSLLRSVAFNASHRYPAVALFEIGHVFRGVDRAAELPEEREHLGVVLAGGDGALDAKHLLDIVVAWAGVSDLTLVAGTVDGLHATRSAEMRRGDAVVGAVGEVDPEVAAAHGIEGRLGWLDLDLGLLLPAERLYVEARPVSRYPSSDIDLAFVVADDVPAALVQAALAETAGPLLVDLRLFDVYRGAGVPDAARSLAFRLRFQALDRTLTDEEVAEVRSRCIAGAATSGATLRA